MSDSVPTVLRALDRLDAAGARALWRLTGHELAAAWFAATERLPEAVAGELPDADRRALATSSGLSPAGLSAALEVVVAGVRTDACRALLEDTPGPPAPLPPALAILPSNVPGLALQCLLPALAARRPLLLKTASAEPVLTPFVVERLCSAEPRLESALATASWSGGDRAVEDAVLARVQRLVAYGSDGALRDLRGRSGDVDASGLVAHGHKISLALVVAGGSVDVRASAEALARDVALFDQRGCLSVHSVLVLDPAQESAAPRAVELAASLATALAAALEQVAERWPPGPAPAGLVAAVRALRDEAVMAGARVADLSLRAGTVVLAPPDFARAENAAALESPGLRCVRVVPVASEARLLALLAPWRDRLQGLALAPEAALGRGLEHALADLGFSRMAPAGELQAVDAATWRNGGVEPLAMFSA